MGEVNDHRRDIYAPISGATNDTYTIDEADVNNYLQITVTYSQPAPLVSPQQETAVTAAKVLAATGPGTAGTLALSEPQPAIDDSVTASLTDPDSPDTTTYSWVWARSSDRSNWANISGATSASYTAAEADAGNYLRATITYTDDSGAGQTADTATTRQVPIDADYDADYDGRINGNEVLTAVRHYFDEIIDGPRVLQVVRLYFRNF